MLHLHRDSPYDWTWAKTLLTLDTGVPDDALHLMAGMLILTLAALLLRRPPWTWGPWLAVVLAESANEAWDLTHAADEGNWRDSWHDFWLTLLWPTVILLVYRRWAPSPAPVAPASADEVEQPLEQPPAV